jgi:GNAT superfamily N-acetyltransferase
VDIEQLHFDDEGSIKECHLVHLAAHHADDPEGSSWMSAAPFRGWLSVGWEGDPREVWLIRGTDGTVTGWYKLELPDRENVHRASLDLVVHPAHRLRGLGNALLRHAVARAVAHERTRVSGSAWDGSAGEAFARRAGAYPTLADIKRVQELAELPADRLAELHATAERAAAGYTLTSWTGLVPERFLDGVAAVITALDDAPRTAGSERREWNAERVRADVNGIFPHLGLRQRSIAALHDASGAMAALTQVWIDPAIPDWGFQGITAVTREHRGHRLGLLTKAAMLDVLMRSEPQINRLETWNAAANAHMIAVNEALGYRVYGPPNTQWELDVSAAGGN